MANINHNPIVRGSKNSSSYPNRYAPVKLKTTQYSIYYNSKKLRAVALETVCLTALNKQSRHRPICDRQIPMMINSGAQRIIVSSKQV